MLQGADVSSAQLSISFTGDHTFDAALLGSTLVNFSALVHEVVGQDNEKHVCSIQVTSFEEGSFLTHLRIILERLPQIDLPSWLENAANLVTVVSAFFNAKKFSKADKPSSIVTSPGGNRVLITTPDGTQIEAPVGTEILYKRKGVDLYVAAISRAASLSGREMRITNEENGETFSYDVPVLKEMAQTQHFPEDRDSSQEETERVTLPIVKVALVGSSKWSFQYGRRTIQASIEDQEFLAAVHNGESSYSAGDKLDVDLLRHKHLDADHSLISESYAVTHVYRKISPAVQAVQTSLFDDPQ